MKPNPEIEYTKDLRFLKEILITSLGLKIKRCIEKTENIVVPQEIFRTCAELKA